MMGPSRRTTIDVNKRQRLCTLIPPAFIGNFAPLLEKSSGQAILAGIGVCLLGIAICGRAGFRKARELPDGAKKQSVSEFSFMKGLWIAVFAGVMSSCMAFAFAVGNPIADVALRLGTPDLYTNTPVLVVTLLGGFCTNAVYCGYLLRRRSKKSPEAGVETAAPPANAGLNLLMTAIAGVTWYCQFFFYGMGTRRMGKYDFSSWTIHMAFIIVFSNLWGLYLHEWKGSSKRTHWVIFLGILVLIASTIVVGRGNYLAAKGL